MFLDEIIILDLLIQIHMPDPPTIGYKYGRLDHEVHNMIEGPKTHTKSKYYERLFERY